MDFAAELLRQVSRVEAGIDRLLPAASEPSARLHAAMRYSTQAGGKRLRPVLVLASSDLFANPQGADPVPSAVAVECIHTYSLVHDDLPCMDDDDLRRGRPTLHKAYDEATALLAGDALLTRAFAILAESYRERPALAVSLLGELADAAGSRRLIAGQMEDLLAERNYEETPEGLKFIHLNKTAAMIEAAFAMGGMCAGVPAAQIDSLRVCGRELGLAFQIVDDVLDMTQSSEELGKTAGKDTASTKATWPAVFGIDQSLKDAQELIADAFAALQPFGPAANPLKSLAQYLVERKN
jgi:geranylgeranyl pyrophosphate synthase